MCLSVPAKVINIEGKKADVLVYGQRRQVYLTVDDVKSGDWVLIYGGMAITVLDADAAKETLSLMEKIQH